MLVPICAGPQLEGLEWLASHRYFIVSADVDMQEGPMDDREFAVPEICPEKPEPSLAGRFHKHTGGLARMRSLLPNAHYGAHSCYQLSIHGKWNTSSSNVMKC